MSKVEFSKLTEYDKESYIDDYIHEVSFNLKMNKENHDNFAFIVKFLLFKQIVNPVIKNSKIVKIKEIAIDCKSHKLFIVSSKMSEEKKKLMNENNELKAYVIIGNLSKEKNVVTRDDRTFTLTNGEDYA